MALGTQFVIKLHDDPVSGASVLDSVQLVTFNHDTSFVAASTSVLKEDFTGSINDAFTVKVSYPSGGAPAGGTSLNTILATAVAAVNAAFPSGGGTGPST